MALEAAQTRDRRVRRIIILEGCANGAVLVLKVVVGLATGSLAVLGDAIHSLADLANNAVAWLIVGLSARPADREHPYGHRKFETLAVFALASLLVVLALELALGALRRETEHVSTDGFMLGLMLVVLGVNVALASWEGAWARRLRSDILLADARHTLADVLTTVVVIAGWQLAASGVPWLDTLCALGVALLILFLAYGLFRRAVPVLVDQVAIEPEALIELVRSVPGVRRVKEIRSRSTGSSAAIDMVITVDRSLSAGEAHAVADAIEAKLRDELSVADALVHIEPEG